MLLRMLSRSLAHNVKALAAVADIINQKFNQDMKPNTENQTSQLPEAAIDPMPMLGDVLLQGSCNLYHVEIKCGGETYDWYVERCRTEHLHYTNTLEIWCRQRFQLKTSVKRKMKRIVEDAVKNLA